MPTSVTQKKFDYQRLLREHNNSDESIMYAHVSFKLRTKIWAGEYVDIASLLPESPKDEPRYALAVRSGEHGSEPLVCVAAKSLGR